jgi:hypothetical protein
MTVDEGSIESAVNRCCLFFELLSRPSFLHFVFSCCPNHSDSELMDCIFELFFGFVLLLAFLDFFFVLLVILF